MQWSEIRLVWLNYLYFGTHRLQLQTESPFKLSLVDLHISREFQPWKAESFHASFQGIFWFSFSSGSLYCSAVTANPEIWAPRLLPSQSQLLSDTASSLTQRETLYSVGISSNWLLRGPLGSAVPSQRQACNRQWNSLKSRDQHCYRSLGRKTGPFSQTKYRTVSRN